MSIVFVTKNGRSVKLEAMQLRVWPKGRDLNSLWADDATALPVAVATFALGTGAPAAGWWALKHRAATQLRTGGGAGRRGLRRRPKRLAPACRGARAGRSERSDGRC